MVNRRRRHFFESDAAALLAAIKACRDACIDALRKASPTAPIAARTLTAIDGVAEVLTGDRHHFWMKPHSSAWWISSDQE
jgi:hypothetical protein